MQDEVTPAEMLMRMRTVQRAVTEALVAAIRYDRSTRALSIVDVTAIDLRPRVSAEEIASLVADAKGAIDELSRIFHRAEQT